MGPILFNASQLKVIILNLHLASVIVILIWIWNNKHLWPVFDGGLLSEKAKHPRTGDNKQVPLGGHQPVVHQVSVK